MAEPAYEANGMHLLAELNGGTYQLLNNMAYLKSCAMEAVEKAKAGYLGNMAHQFYNENGDEQGSTILIGLSESHTTLHTSPELQHIAVDIFTCGNKAMPYIALNEIIIKTQTKQIILTDVSRTPKGQKIQFSNKKMTRSEWDVFYKQQMQRTAATTVFFHKPRKSVTKKVKFSELRKKKYLRNGKSQSRVTTSRESARFIA